MQNISDEFQFNNQQSLQAKYIFNNVIMFY